jgi:ornithine decarboxylase
MDELEKIQKYLPKAELLLRIFANDSDALIPLGDKFGASIESSLPLLQRAKALGLNVSGVSFHVGMFWQEFTAFRPLSSPSLLPNAVHY